MDSTHERRWFWATLVLSSISIVAVVFAFWELVENHYFREMDYVSLHYLYISRSIASSLLLAIWAAWYVLRQRQASEDKLRRSREHYRGLLHASPGAVILFDDDLLVSEWNTAAEHLYGYSRSEVRRQSLPTVPQEKQAELHSLMRRVQEDGETILDVETLRRHKDGTVFDVQLSLLPFRESDGTQCYMEVTSDIREKVRLRRTLLEVEKLTSMGKMAAGTAHHLNTPLAAMLLRVQMMRERARDNGLARDLEQFEKSLVQCQQFVRRLLDFSRRPLARKQLEDVSSILEAVAGFLAPTLMARKVELSMGLNLLSGQMMMCDRNQLESLFIILISNAIDAMPDGGKVRVYCRQSAPDEMEIVIADNGCGIAAADLKKLFEPFFTTKPTGKGTGLGLAIAKNIVQEHGGSIRLESTPGSGTSAIVALPLCHRLAACVGDGP
ncbi:MAG: nitrogen regulation protein NR(II) [Terriglobales bacterium]